MRTSRFSLLSLAVASVTGSAIAQGDECTGALNVAQGLSGPYTNAGSSTSFAWPCAAGGSDVWFSYVAPGNGTLTVDTCTGTNYDSAIEIFDGNLGCGSLVSLACNDDFCGLQSTASTPVSIGTQYYIRVGGFVGLTGTFQLNVNGPTGSGTVATASNYGVGCVSRYASFFEHMDPASTFDLNNTSMTMLRTNPGYVVLGLGTYVPPTGAAVNLGLGDDDEVVQPLTTAFPYDGGVTPSLAICSNGIVSVATGNTTDYIPDVGVMLNDVQTAWWCWHDYNPSAVGGGVVKFQEIGSVAYITWDAVWDYAGTSAANASTFQMQFDSTSGNVTFAWQTMSPLGGGTATGFLVGYSPGGSSVNPGPTDISVALPGTFSVLGADMPPLLLTSNPRPIANTTISLDTSNIPAGSPFGAIILGLNNPGISLAPQMIGCTQYTDGLATMLFVGPGTSHSLSFAVPNAVGVTIKAQSAVYCPAAGLTLLGAIASNGRDLSIGNL
jgi:hypothetical protein